MNKLSVKGLVVVAMLFAAPAPIWAQQNQNEDCAVGVVGNIALNMRTREITIEIDVIGRALERYNLQCLRGIVARFGIGFGLPDITAGLTGAICAAIGNIRP